METAFVVVALLGILNALFWPLLSRIFLPFMVFTVGVGSLLLNGFLIWIISNFVPGITIGGPALILTPLGITLITTTLSSILTLDDDASYYRTVLRRRIKESEGKEFNNIPAFRWVEKPNNNKVMVSTGLDDANIIEERISDGKGLLSSWCESF